MMFEPKGLCKIRSLHNRFLDLSVHSGLDLFSWSLSGDDQNRSDEDQQDAVETWRSIGK